MKYAFIGREAARHSIARLCRVMAVSRSGYYGWRDRAASRRAMDDRRLLGHIRDLHRRGRLAYGALKTWRVLQAQGIAGGKHRVTRLHRQHGIEARRKRRFRNAVTHQLNLPPAPNLLQRRFDIALPNRV